MHREEATSNAKLGAGRIYPDRAEKFDFSKTPDVTPGPQGPTFLQMKLDELAALHRGLQDLCLRIHGFADRVVGCPVSPNEANRPSMPAVVPDCPINGIAGELHECCSAMSNDLGALHSALDRLQGVA